jgi:hypothetical protein
MEHVGTCSGHSKYFTVIWYILWRLGNVVVIWYICPRIGILCQEKSGNPAYDQSKREPICVQSKIFPAELFVSFLLWVPCGCFIKVNWEKAFQPHFHKISLLLFLFLPTL